MNSEGASIPLLAQQILESMTTAVLVFGPEFRLRYINPAGEVLYAVSARSLQGKRADDLMQCPQGSARAGLQRVLLSRHPFTERELHLRLPDGRGITVDCTVSPLSNPGGEGMLLIELQQLDRQLRISREEHLLVQQQAAKALARGLAHEIKNPLGGLRGAAQLLERELPDDSLREYTRVIIEEADRLRNLINRMLGPNKHPRREALNIHQVLERVRVLVEAETGRQVPIERDYDPSLPAVIGDSEQLIQAFLNLVRNAAQSVGDDGRIILRTRILRQFTIGHLRHRLVVRVDIVDNGPGISQSMQEQIFYPMVTDREDGMGLGLPIAQSLINQHGGLIECRSEPAETVFSVLLPVEDTHGHA